jgi:hypothetical protein
VRESVHDEGMTKPTDKGNGDVHPAEDVPTAPMPALGGTPTATMGAAIGAGAPPAMPVEAAGSPHTGGVVDEPARMPSPDELPGGAPDDPAPAPGHVPPGDACSLRRGGEFALVYRIGSAVIGRFGVVGTRGQWRTVEYGSAAAASRAYADEAARLIADGYTPLG